MPYVMGEGNKKLSKRDPESNLFLHRDRGFLPEGLLNYLSLLGWSLTHDRDVFTTDEMIAAFDVTDVNPNPARFDLKKAESINGDHIRMLPADEFARRIAPYLGELVSLPEDEPLLRAAAPLVQERMQLLGEAPGLLAFLFTADDEIAWDADALPKSDARPTLDAALAALRELEDWTTETTEDALRRALIDGLGLKPRVAFGPVRSAISGRRISPPLFESMELLGKVSTIARIERLAATL
jgi:glutamyl-tRNA synthetase